MYSANLAHGQNTGGTFNYVNQAAILSTADIVATQEASVGDLGSWDLAFAAKGLARAVYFPNSSGPGNTGDGQAIWYRPCAVKVLETYTRQLSSGFIGYDGSTNVDKSAIAVKVDVSGRTFVVVNAHLCWSRCADSQDDVTTGYSQQRVAQINELLSWIENTFAGYEVVIAGDMNFSPAFPKQPSGYQLDLFTANYFDLWQQGLAGNRAHAAWGDRDGNGAPDMPVDNHLTRTHDTRRVDYFFLNKTASVLSLERIEVPDLRANCAHSL
ncbi:MAG TPA: endonuclease/exonuclease/phosphatase family protein, partial [Pyrinomonadaceae bacterium]|nr:endonuclease/exonuclease/phosphatase family protein [Pyrinomonadaceae bacterium]